MLRNIGHITGNSALLFEVEINGLDFTLEQTTKTFSISLSTKTLVCGTSLCYVFPDGSGRCFSTSPHNSETNVCENILKLPTSPPIFYVIYYHSKQAVAASIEFVTWVMAIRCLSGFCGLSCPSLG